MFFINGINLVEALKATQDNPLNLSAAYYMTLGATFELCAAKEGKMCHYPFH